MNCSPAHFNLYCGAILHYHENNYTAIIVGVLSAITALAVGFIAYKAQKTQVKSIISTFRSEWKKEIRDLFSDFISIATLMHFRVSRNKKYILCSAADDVYAELLKKQVSILIMLDKTKDYYHEIEVMMNKIADNIAEENSAEDVGKLIDDLIDKANIITEKAWTDMQRDIGIKITKH